MTDVRLDFGGAKTTEEEWVLKRGRKAIWCWVCISRSHAGADHGYVKHSRGARETIDLSLARGPSRRRRRMTDKGHQAFSRVLSV